MTDTVTGNLSNYIKEKGVSVAKISSATKIPAGVLYPSIQKRRALRTDEFFTICKFLEVDPKQFYTGTA